VLGTVADRNPLLAPEPLPVSSMIGLLNRCLRGMLDDLRGQCADLEQSRSSLLRLRRSLGRKHELLVCVPVCVSVCVAMFAPGRLLVSSLVISFCCSSARNLNPSGY
jgi:hypothetical protein